MITELGRSLYEQGSSIQQEAEQQLFSQLSPDDGSRLADIFAKLESARGATRR